MQRWTSFTLRAGFIIGFLIVLPVMAMPSVASFLDRLLYGQPESSVPLVIKADAEFAPRKQPEQSRADASPAAYEVPLPEEPSASGIAGNFQPPPPSLQRAPDFLPRDEKLTPGNDSVDPVDVGPLDPATAQKIDAVRGRLEELGAEYVRLEMSEDGRTFHCLCDMLLGGGTKETQPFEATRNDPLAAAKAVLANVEAWRKAESTPHAPREESSRGAR
ncbi:MAG: hypothetical protein IAF94_22795 [Pirellulaceae bacterium]|nr:hypothetical protein [Pirellulaceae bacterium]